ncbi:MAG TPA: cardiolipin synthase [Firmicutes bacterium]|nr:cardiolipin synthase [Bacillota bacterium]
MKKSQDHARQDHPMEAAGAFATYLRIGIIALLILIQLGMMWAITYFLKTNVAFLYIFFDAVALITVISLINRHDSSAYRIAWLVIVLTIPVFGLLLYFAWGRVDFNKKERGAFKASFTLGFSLLPQDAEAAAAFQEQFPSCKTYAGALRENGYPLYGGTDARYFPSGEEYFEQLERDLQAAEKFIFIEYFIVATGVLWDRVHKILLEKIRQGVEVRMLYDDVGCFFKIPDNFDKLLRAEGFKAAVFSPAHRFVSDFYMNYRNHQKIVVIDGQVGYCGGVNLADEYINVNSKLGHWKDTGIRLEGSAVRSLTVIFLQMWDISVRHVGEDFSRYLLERPVPGAAGYFQPYADGPANNPRNPALDLIRQAAGGAREYLWLTSPYLIIDHDLSDDLCLTARSGVDVRIITPAVPDHWYVGVVNRENYRHLLESGVRIFEYTPGFIHAKLMVFDDRCATVGSVNLDYRSLFLHYENGVFLCGAPAVAAVKEDIERTLALSREITLEEVRRRPWYRKLTGAVFSLFAPLM